MCIGVRKCEYYEVCIYKRKDSLTCLTGGGNYCGKYREFKEKVDEIRKKKERDVIIIDAI